MSIERSSGSVAELLSGEIPRSLDGPRTIVYELSATTLILGSSQRAEALVDAGAVRSAGIQVAQRHSGGGAVLLAPGRCLWLDILLPRTDPRWSDDVVRAAFWLGDLWAAAFRTLGVHAEVHRSGLQKTRWGGLVCFGALGPGEVVIGGRKVVGIAQRRTRDGARFQCLVHAQWEPAMLLNLFALTPAERETAHGEVADFAAGPGVPLSDLEAAVLGQVPQS